MALTEFPMGRAMNFEDDCRQWRKSDPNEVRPDAVIEEEIWQRILKDHSLGCQYLDHLLVEVEDGRVCLRGHVLKAWHSPLITSIAHQTEGVVLVKNELVADENLREQVIQALTEDEWTAPYIFTVTVRFGWINLGGVVPSREIAKHAESVVGAVPFVRGVLSLPAVFGEEWFGSAANEPARRALQPRHAAVVYQDGLDQKPVAVGLVSKVMIDPCSRLVSAIAVRITAKGAQEHSSTERLIPITAIEAANEKGVWLKTGEDINQYAGYEPRQYPLPPPNWRPPFPYHRGSIRWSLSE